MDNMLIVATVLTLTLVWYVWYFYLRARIRTTHDWQHRQTRQSNRILRQIAVGQLRIKAELKALLPKGRR